MRGRKDVTHMKAGKIMIMMLAAVMLTGCQPKEEYIPTAPTIPWEPEPEIVFETMPAEPISRVEFARSVTSLDGTTEYTFNIDQEVALDALAVVEVEPYMADGEDGKRMAEILMPGKEFYEKRPNADPITKAELQDKIDFYTRYADTERLKEVYARDWADDLEWVKYQIGEFEKQMDKAPDKEKVPTDWELKPKKTYFNSEWEIDSEPETPCLFAVTDADGVAYMLDVWQADHNGERFSTLCISTRCSVNGDFEDFVIRSRIFRTEEPDEACIEKLKAQAEGWLNQMELGKWKVVDAEVKRTSVGNTVEYEVWLEAEPIINGLVGMKAAFGGIRPNAMFILSANGDLYYFDMGSPIQNEEILHGQLAPMTMDMVLEKAAEYLSERNSLHVLGAHEEAHRLKLEKQAGEKIIRKTEITGLEFRMGSVPVPNVKNRYFYMPVVGFQATSEYVGADSGKQYEALPEDEEPRSILWVNSFEGNIVEQN